MSEPLKVFITYSHNDSQQNTVLKTRLTVMEEAGKIDIWDDNKILPGDEWEKDISNNLAASDILLYLVSATSLASKNCNKELAEALNLKIKVIPIILESCDWLEHQLSRFEVLPHKGKPINKWQPESDSWQNVVDGLRKAVDKMQSQMAAPSRTFEKELRAELAFQQGNVLMMLRQMDKAIERYSHAIKLNPNYAYAYNNRGFAYERKGDFDLALQDYNTAIKLNPDLAGAYANRGDVYRITGKIDRAIEDCTTAIKLDSKCIEAHNNRGVAYVSTGEFDLAIEDYDTAIKLNPKLAVVYNNRGNAYRDKGDFDRAIVDYTKAIETGTRFCRRL